MRFRADIVTYEDIKAAVSSMNANLEDGSYFKITQTDVWKVLEHFTDQMCKELPRAWRTHTYVEDIKLLTNNKRYLTGLAAYLMLAGYMLAVDDLEKERIVL